MRHGSLFSGIGGFDLAAEWMGWENVFHCEWNSFGQKILKHYWPNAISYEDITKTDFTVHRGNIDILTGGFPCQPYSMAGKRLGKEDERHLWPQMLRAIREIKPRWVVGENVLGLVNWSDGLVFHEVQTDLEAEGYEVFPFVLPAASVGAPHRRDRVWFVAYSKSNGNNRGGQCRDNKRESSEERVGPEFWNQFNNNGKVSDAADSNSNELNERNSEYEVNASEGREYAQRDIKQGNDNGYAADTDLSRCGQSHEENERRTSKQFDGDSFQSNAINTIGIGRDKVRNEKRDLINGKGKREFSSTNSIQNWWRSFPSVSPICNGDDGLSDRLDAITFPKWRNESIKAGGNAIVPQVVFQIFKAIEQYEKENAPA